MAIQKDINNNNKENKAIEPIRANISNYYNVADHGTYVSLAERSQKVVTAIYMVTDFLDTNDALRSLLRTSATESMKDLFSLTHSHKMNRVETLSRVHAAWFAVISYLEIAFRNGFISDMNFNVIRGEIEKLRTDIDLQIKKSLPYDRKENNTLSVREFSFSDSFFNTPTQSQGHKKFSASSIEKNEVINDTPHNDQANVKDKESTQDEQPVFVKKTSPKQAFHDAYEKKRQAVKPLRKKIIREPKPNEAKEERKENILKILKQKRDASINDISTLFKDISTKTIQRDLTELIDEGLIIKEGSRRWSKYNLSF